MACARRGASASDGTVRAVLVLFAKLAAAGLLFAPQWGLLWHRPTVLTDQFGGAVPGPWVSDIAQSLWATRGPLQAVIYVLLCMAAVASVFAVPFLHSRAVRIALSLAILLLCGFDLTILDINGSFLTRNMLLVLWEERAQAAGAVAYYGKEGLRNGIFVLALLPAFAVAPPARYALGQVWTYAPLLPLVLVTAAIAFTGGNTSAYPLPTGTAANALASVVATRSGGSHPFLAGQSGTRSLEAPPASAQRMRHIVMIMDESVRGDALSLNGGSVDNTPSLRTDPRVINFGIAVAGANCSTQSRIMFRYGMRADSWPSWREAINGSTMWDYAKAAGYRTVYIDAFAGPLLNLSGFSPLENKTVDAKISITDRPDYERDGKIAARIADLLTQDRDANLFVYVDKFGVHAPYGNKYPSDRKVFIAPDGADEVREDRADYDNAILWSVDGFFAALRTRMPLDDTLLIYTSDHGVSLRERYKQSHCTEGGAIVAGEGLVPLLAQTGDAALDSRLRESAKRGFGRFSHFEIFPTLLTAMGYPPDWVRAHYGGSLFDAPPDRPRFFYAGSPIGSSRRVAVPP